MMKIFKWAVKWFKNIAHYLRFVKKATDILINKEERACRLAKEFALTFEHAFSIVELTDAYRLTWVQTHKLVYQANEIGIDPFVYISQVVSVIHNKLVEEQKENGK